MVSVEIEGAAYEFIKKNKNCGQEDVVKGLKKVCTRNPILEAIGDLISIPEDGSEPRVISWRTTPKGKHHFYVNDSNNYNILENKIERLGKKLDRWTKYYADNQPQNKKEFRDLAGAYQFIMNSALFGIVEKIESEVESEDKRNTLFLRLIPILNTASKINRKLQASLHIEVDKFLSMMIPEMRSPRWTPEKRKFFRLLQDNFNLNDIVD